MASLTPRASVLWSDSIMSNSYFPDDEDSDIHQRLVDPDPDDPDDDRTPLDKTIDRIGMGSYQWALLSLCGFGWMADNMWIQAVAIILPRVQQHYSVSDSYIGSLSSSMFAGMMIGAVGWGTCSDLLGRSTAFNATLFFTAVFGLAASFANSFLTLCIALFFLGSAVGGSMPTDGTLLLEHMPKAKQYLVTALSVFFSFGSVVSAFVALLILPGNTCQSNDTTPASGLALLDCDPEVQNRGWKYLLMILAFITLSMFLARIVFFRLHESPRYLVHAGRPQEAVKSLQMISKFNGSDLEIELDDVEDHHPPSTSVTSPSGAAGVGASQGASLPTSSTTTGASAAPIDIRSKVDETTVFDAGDIDGTGNSKESTPSKSHNSSSSSSSSDNKYNRPALVTQYDATGQAPTNPLEGHSFITPQTEYVNPFGFTSASATTTPSSTTVVSNNDTTTNKDKAEDEEDAHVEEETNKYPRRLSFTQRPLLDPELPPLRRYPSGMNGGPSRRLSLASSRRLSSASRRSSSYYEYERKCRILPRRLRRPLATWWDRVSMVLEPEWFRTTMLVWAVWFSMSLAFTMFNVYFPKLLELASESEDGGSVNNNLGVRESMGSGKSLEQNLWDVMIFTLGGTPGAILGAWLIESSLGRRLSLAISTFTTAIFCVVFVMVESTWAVRMSTIGISLSAATMWAVLYGWTPEIFGTKVRGSACGIASALSRIGGMIAPLLGGTLLTISRSVPVYTSVVTFVVAGFCVLLLKEGVGDSPDRTGRGRGRPMAH